MAGQTILLTRQDIAAHFDPLEAVAPLERAMAEFERGSDYLPPKAIYEVPLPEQGAWAVCLAGMTQASGLLTMKLGQERTHNPTRQLPTTSSWITVFDPVTGELLMICDGTLPTMMRTAAAAAIAAKHLARPDSRVLAVIGAGQLGRQCARIVRHACQFTEILLHDDSARTAREAAEYLASTVNIPVRVVDARSACARADVIVTATNSRKPILMSEWVRNGTHLSCMGSDLPEKIECEMQLLPKCRLYADKVDHAIARGEVSQAVAAGVLSQDCFAGSLGQVINGAASGRTHRDQITLFDGVGLGIQDTTIARCLLDQAHTRGLGTRICFG